MTDSELEPEFLQPIQVCSKCSKVPDMVVRGIMFCAKHALEELRDRLKIAKFPIRRCRR